MAPTVRAGALEEEGLKLTLAAAIAPDFLLVEEVPGYWKLNQQKIRIDYLAMPQPHLVAMGFPRQWFGIEVKHFSNFQEHGRGKKAKLIWQAIKYAQSEFKLNGKAIEPNFIALYVGDHSMIHEPSRGAYDWHVLMNLAVYSKIVEFELKSGKPWKLIGAGGTFFSRTKGMRNLRFHE